MRGVLRRTFEASLDRFRQRGRSALGRMVRLTAAAVASYVVAGLVFPGSAPLLAPLTALLVVQLTPVSILTSGIQRVASVVAGVTVAVVFSSLVDLTWWSLGTLIGLSLLIGQLLRLGSNLLEVPISAMLVLGVGSRTAETAAWQRILETLVGAGVGVASNLLFPPKVVTEDAAAAIGKLGDALADLLDTAAHDLADDDVSTGALSERAPGWLGQARLLTHDIPNVGAALLRAEDSRRLNIRALVTADSGPGLRQGLEALEHSALTLRSMFRSFLEAARAYAADDREFPGEVRAAGATLMGRVVAALRSYAGLVRAEAHPGEDTSALAELRDRLERLREARAQVDDVLLIDPRADTALAVLTSSLLASSDRLLQELSLDDRMRRVREPALLRPHLTHPRSRRDGSTRYLWPRRRRGDQH